MRRNGGQSVNAARCAILSTFALVGYVLTHGSLRALLGLLWILLLIAAFAFQWQARRRWREEQAAQASRPDRRRRKSPPKPS